jgi:hypothetical protein
MSQSCKIADKAFHLRSLKSALSIENSLLLLSECRLLPSLKAGSESGLRKLFAGPHCQLIISSSDHHDGFER